MELLFVNCCMKPDKESRTYRLATEFIDRLSEGNDVRVTEVALKNESIEAIDNKSLNYRLKLIEEEAWDNRVFRYARKFAAADVIVIAGDIFTSNYDGLKDPEKYSAAMSKMHAKYGVYAVCGNHDVDENLFGGFSVSPLSEAFRIPEMERFFDDSGFNVLYDESVELGDGLFTLVGRVDGEKAGDGTANRLSPQELLKDTDKTKPVIVLQHEPIEFEGLAESGANMVLCGHTHNGQIFPGNIVVPFFNENGYGVKDLYGTKTVVTAGVGYYGPPMRFGTDSEVTLINVKIGA